MFSFSNPSKTLLTKACLESNILFSGRVLESGCSYLAWPHEEGLGGVTGGAAGLYR